MTTPTKSYPTHTHTLKITSLANGFDAYVDDHYQGSLFEVPEGWIAHISGSSPRLIKHAREWLTVILAGYNLDRDEALLIDEEWDYCDELIFVHQFAGPGVAA